MKWITNNEVNVIKDMLSETTEDSVILDIGANMGVHSLFVGKIAKNVNSVEPHPVNLSHLSINSVMNESNINIFSCGLSDSEGYKKIAGPRAEMEVDGSASIERTYDGGNTDSVFVKLERGDKFIQKNNLQTPQIVKIDVEGAEKRVLQGLQDTLESPGCKVVYCEVHDDNIGDICEILESYEYSTNIIGKDRIVKASKRV